MSINPYFFANASGLGPQTGGFNPTPADAISSSLRQNTSRGLLDYSVYTDSRYRALTGLAATGLAGDPTTASNLMRNSAAGQLIKDVAAAAVSSGLLPGGSPTQMAHGVQQMVATQGFNVGGSIGRGSPVFGGGAITDLMSRSVFDAVKSNFYDKVSGLPTKAAHGLNMTQMGDAMNQLTSRGVFRGMNIGDINVNEKGIYEFKRNEQQFTKVNKIFSDYAGMLKDARKIFGDLPIADLTQNAERLIGTSLREMGSISSMRNRIANISATSAAFGLNPAAVAERMMQVTDAVQGGMYANTMSDPRMQQHSYQKALAASAYGRTASDVSENAVLSGLRTGHANAATSNRYAEQGKYVQALDSDQVTQMLAGMGTNILTSETETGYSDNVLAARFMLSMGRIKDPETAKKVEGLLNKMNTTGDTNKLAEINSQIAQEIYKGTGQDVANIKASRTKAEMLAMLNPEQSKAMSKFATEQSRSRLVAEGFIKLSNEGQGYGLLSGETSREAVVDLFKATDLEAQDALFSTLGANGEINENALAAAYQSIPALQEALPKEQFKNIIKQLSSDPARAKGNFRDQLKDTMFQMKASAEGQAGPSRREEILANEREVQTYLTSVSMGESLSKEDFSTELVRGFFGTGKIDNKVVMQSLMNQPGKTSTFGIKAGGGGLSLNEESLDKLADTIGPENFAKLALQLGENDLTDKSGLIKKLGTSEGFKALRDNLGDTGMETTKDGLILASGKDIEKETKELETQSMVTAKKRLLGQDKKVVGDLTTEEGRKAYNKDILGELTKNKGAKLSELADKFKKGDYLGEDFESLAMLAKSNPEIRKAITDSARNAYASKDREGGDNLMALDRKIEATNSEGSGKYLGILEFATDSFSQFQLFQKA